MSRPVSRWAIPAAGPGLALLFVGVVVVLVASWPERSDLANASWYPVAVTRTGGLALWGWLAGGGPDAMDAALRREQLVRIAVAAVATVPLELLAFAASAPDASFAWSAAIALPLAIAMFGVSWSLSATLRRGRVAWLLPLASPLVATGILWLDLRVGPPLLLPWLLPSAPSWAAAALLVATAAGTVYLAVVRGRGEGPR